MYLTFKKHKNDIFEREITACAPKDEVDNKQMHKQI